MASKSISASAEFKDYIAKPEVKELYDTMKVSAKAIDGVESAADFLAKRDVKRALEKLSPALAHSLAKVSELAGALGPAGVALGVGCDLLIAFGLLPDATMEKLNLISHHIKEVQQELKTPIPQLETNLELHRFFLIFDKLLANVCLFEQNVAGSATNGEVLYQNLAPMVENYSPTQIAVDLKQMHNLIVGSTPFGKPLFEQLAEGANSLKGQELNNFISTLLLQFQAVVALEMRAVRMLRSFIALQQQDTVFATHIQAIFKDLAMQRSQCDPTLIFKWYLSFKALGCTTIMTTAQWPNWHVYMQDNDIGNVRGWENHPGDQGVFIITPTEDETFLISTEKWPWCYVYMQNNSTGNVQGRPGGNPGPQGNWLFTIKDVQKRTFLLSPARWPDWYMYMQANGEGNVRGWEGDPGPQGHFILGL